MDDTSSRRVGAALVAAQFALMGLLGVLALLGLAVGGDGASAGGFVPAGAALALAAGVGTAALAANRPGNFNIRPVPREGGRLVTHGIYRWIRHPMYTAVLLGGLACVIVAPRAGTAVAWAAALAWLALATVLWVKSGVEEQAMVLAHPAYADYRRQTRRFVPGLL